MGATTALAVTETITAFAAGLFFLWMTWRLWSFARRRARLDRQRLSVPEALLVTGIACWTLCFFGLSGLSVVYPFDLRGRMHPPAGSLGASLEVGAFVCLPAGALLMAVAAGLAAYRSHTTRI